MSSRNDGQFTKGSSGNPKGRPPRRYSVTAALAEIADQPATIDDDGTPVTNAQLAARWLWSKAISGMDDQGVPLPTKERADILKLAMERSEPTAGLLKLWEQDGDDDEDERSQELARRMEKLTDEELEALSKLGLPGRISD